MSGTLPTWLARLLGINAQPGEGTLWTLEYTWAWPPWATLLFAMSAVAFVVAIYFHDARQSGSRYRLLLAVIRLALVGMVLMMIAQVGLSFQRTGLPYVAVLLDDSLSMTIVDTYDEKLQEAMQQRVDRAMAGSGPQKLQSESAAENVLPSPGVQGEAAGGSPGAKGPGTGPSANHQLSRWNLALTLLAEKGAALLKRIAKDYRLRVYYLTGVRPSDQSDPEGVVEQIRSMQPSGESTRLGSGVASVLDDLRGTAPAAVVLLSDGINTEGPSLAEAALLARRRGVPLFTVGLGSDKPVRDLKLADLLVDDVVFVDDVVNFECSISSTGFEGRQVPVVLREQGKPAVLAKTEVTLAADGRPQEVRLTYRPPQAGRFRYVVEAQPQKGEIQTDNNRQERTVEVRKEKIHVLLAQAYPSYEYRYLQRTLKRDETIALHTVLQDADPEYGQQDAAALPVFPVRREEIFSYDVIILGDVNPALLGESVMQNLVDFVDEPGKGGALILIAGWKYMPLAYRDTPLARLIPVKLGSARCPDPDAVITQGFQVQPTELGLASPPMQLGDSPAQTRTIWQNLPPLYWLLEAPDLKPGTRQLAVDPLALGPDGRPLPVICMQYVGAGKVLFHATDETWRWRRGAGDVFFARYWIQMIRYLSRCKLAGAGRSATLTADRRQYTQGQPVRLRVRFADDRLAPAEDDGVTVVLQHEGQKTQRIRLRRGGTTSAGGGRGMFTAQLGNLPLGTYHAWMATAVSEGRAPAVDFAVTAPPGEFENVRMDAAALERAAKQSNGRFYTFQNAQRLPKDLPPGHQVPIESLPRKPLWNRWPVLLVCLLLLVGEWILRKLGNMV